MEHGILRKSLRLKSGAGLRETTRKLLTLIVLICCGITAARATVSVTPGPGGSTICSNKAVTGPSPGFTALGPIVITEGVFTDFSTGTDVLILYPPAGWQFSTTVPSITFITGSNITAATGSISSTALTVNITVANVTGPDQFTINGLQVQPLTTTSLPGNINAVSSTGINGIVSGAGGTNFGLLSVAAPLVPSITITSSHPTPFCPGTNVSFTPSPVNGGTSPSYTWTVNGANVWIGATYTTGALTNGNNVVCKMVSSLGCLTTNPVFSNTITASVLPAPSAITGSNTICPGTSTLLATTSTGGVWSSSNTASATVSTSGSVTGIAAGTTTVSYTAAGCAATRTVFVNNPPFAPVLTPTVSTICNETTLAISAGGAPAGTTILSQNFNGGLTDWTVDVTGSIGILPGSEWKACADSYLNEQGWYRSPDYSKFVMANADTSGSTSTLSAKLISPSFSLAEYAAATLTFQQAYDYWPAGDLYVNLEISTNGGSTWTTITNFKGATIGSKMNFLPQSFSLNAFLGYPDVKIRFYYHSTFGYYWAIDNIMITGVPGVVTPTWAPSTYLYTDPGLTTPYTPGTATNNVYAHPSGILTPTYITYTATSATGACTASATSALTVNPSPGITSGALNLCVATSTTLTNSASGGTWVSSDPTVATINATTGLVSGLTAGTTMISYVLGSSCAALSVVTVSNIPPAVTGNSNVCIGYTNTLANASPGGTWTSSNLAVATVNLLTGEVAGLATGTSTIIYSLGAGCTASKTVTVQPLPAAITGGTVVCATQDILLNSLTTGGQWSSSNTAIATAGSLTGIITGISSGTTTISYTLTSTGCFSLSTLTVNPLGAITGPGNACVGYSSLYENTTTGGTWSSTNATIATIEATSGILNGLTTGTTVVSYTLSSGCIASRVVTVNALPAAITGPGTVCVGSNVTLASATTGGTWSSSNSNSGIHITSGSLSGSIPGTSTITYTAGTGCFTTSTITVNPVPSAITGIATICRWESSTLSSASGGGTWSSSNGVVSVVPAGTGSAIVNGDYSGSSTITYTLPTGCYNTRSYLVNPPPSAITGPLFICQGISATLSSSPSGGTWESGNSIVGPIGSTSGLVTGAAAGTSIITYTLPTSCKATATLTVNPLPATISGSSEVCTGTTITLANAATGGAWTSSNGNVSLTPSGAGATVVTGLSAGTVTVTYTLPTGCIATRIITVNQSPAIITGTFSVCEGSASILACATTGGAWTSSNPAIGSISSMSGVLTGLVAGTTSISYTVSTGCVAVATATVLPVPAGIAGNLNLCPGIASGLSNATTGGTWSSSNTSIATIGSGSGIVTGIFPGASIISYTLATGCYTTSTAIVNPLPSSISGATTLCVGSSTLFGDATGGGSWSSSSGALVTIGSSSGGALGVSAGVATISYTLPTGCYATQALTVNPLPAAITGTANICQQGTGTLTNITGGGVWSSGNMTVGTVGSASGLVTGITGGTTLISYTLPTGCLTSFLVSVTALPATIIGTSSVCVGSTILLTDATTGGSWSSGAPLTGTISTAGVVSGLSAGTTTITYMLPLGCINTKTITVNPLPASITGSNIYCMGTPGYVASITPGGTWSSSNGFVAGVGATTGLVAGFAPGTSVISYTLPTSCYKTLQITVNLTPTTIAGPNTICEGSSSNYTNSTGTGTWSSSNTSVATISTTGGTATGIAAGTATITYSLPNGCFSVKNITVNPLPSEITGGPAICQGLSATLVSSPGGGTWTSGSTFIAFIGSTSGLVNGLSSGTSNITYTLPTGCTTSLTLTVYALPAPLAGSSNLCLGSPTSFTTTTGGGTWSSSNTAIATIDGSGTATGVSLGTATISYVIGVGCIVTKAVTVNPLPPATTGTATSCIGVGTTLTNVATGGTWSSTTSPGIATINATSGFVSPLNTGIATITYTLGTGCYTTTDYTVTATPPIIGNTSICVGTISMLSHSTSGGTWSSSNGSVAGVGVTSGILVGYTVNTAIISYVVPGGCIATKVASINALPAAIGGSGSVCPGFTSALSNSVAGGVWTSTNTGIATIGSATGILSGVSPGTAIVSYTMPSGCAVSKQVTVNTLPPPITGTTNLCAGSSTTLSIATTGGTWSSSNTTIATINTTTGNITGLSGGTATITYRPSTGCIAITVVTVNDLPAAITGASSFCTGTSGTLSDATADGVWSSSNALIASIGSVTGNVTPVSPGTTTIYYTVGLGCAVSKTITVNQSPTAIVGAASVCVGYTTSLGSTPGGGTWSSSNAATASISTSGVVTGIAAGTTIISYGFATGCTTRTFVTVSPLPATITGPTTICTGNTTILTDPAAGGGTWSSSNTAVATTGLATGAITGISTGTAIITYSIGSGCTTNTVVTVNQAPGPIIGVASTCIGMNSVLANTITGGTWSSTATGIATVGSVTGSVLGIAAGTSTISYTLSTGCSKTLSMTVNPSPGPISGIAGLCAGSSFTFTNTVPGGIWSSSNTTTATINSSTGLLTGLSGGTTNVTYTLGAGCYATRAMTVHPLPGGIAGPATVCAGSNVTFTNATSGGTWSSSNTTTATIGATTGALTGLVSGTTTISYLTGSGCSATTTITVNPLSPNSGLTATCTGFSTTLSNPLAGGTWSSSNTTVATVAAGVVSGVAAGTSVISYTLPSGCVAMTTVNVAPVYPIAGTTSICEGNTTLYTNSTPGGTWSSTSVAVASVNATGAVTALTSGTASIIYTFGNACRSVAMVTVNPVIPITGPDVVCQGQSITLTNIITGGTWSTGSGNAAVGATSGIVTGITAGTAMITYTFTTGCTTTKVVTIHATAPITGTGVVCIGSTTSLTNSIGGGTWSSSIAGIASVNASTGIVSGISAGSATISYRLTTGCVLTAPVTVNPLPGLITGSSNVCIGFTTPLMSGSAGGTWSSSNTAKASIDAATGMVAGIAAGTSTITYQLSTGCLRTTEMTVNILPGGITGPSNVCMGSSIGLSNSVPGGTWSSNNTGIAQIGSLSGSVTGVVAGSTIITYELSSGCRTTTSITVDPLPAIITGPNNVCVGAMVTQANATAGGTWSSDGINTSIAPLTGALTGVAPGITTVTYTLTTGCSTVRTITVNALPPAISGPDQLCVGATTTFANATTPGTWGGSDAGVITVGTVSGNVIALNAGTATITYTLPTGCLTTRTVTVNAVPAPIIGASTVCAGLSTSFSSATTGGLWTSGAASISSVNASGDVTGVSAGVASITYTLPSTCATYKDITVNPIPDVITGPGNVCVGQVITMSNTTSGGTWTSSNTAAATIDGTSGIVTGIASGVTDISFTLGTGCTRTIPVTVHSLPAAIAGPSSLCIGATAVFTNLTSGGTWSSSNVAVATVSATGIVTGLSASDAVISYTMPSGCSTTTAITVNPLPPAITGSVNVCPGATTELHNAVAGGIWISAATGIATVDVSTGLVTGMSPGNALISYRLTTGCTSSIVVHVNTPPAAIAGSFALCAMSTTTLTNSTTGGTWISGSGGVATIGTYSGIVNGLTNGTSVISYVLPTGCLTTQTVTVNPLPPAIAGAMSACLGAGMTLTNAIAGGTWTSSIPTTASIGASSGVITGLALGNTTIIYTLPTGCQTSTMITVHPLPSAIVGPGVVCQGSSAVYSNGTPGGLWSSSNMTVATTGSITGVAICVGAGTTEISYTLSTGCSRSMTLTVNPLFPITGNSGICIGDTATYHNASIAGTWSSSTLSVATISSTGLVSGIAPGIVVISYTLSSGCVAMKTVTVNQLPVAYYVGGGGTFCVGNPGVPVTLSGSASGFGYQLYNGTTAGSYMDGTGSSISFGPQNTSGIYTVVARNLTTGCTRNMLGSATVSAVSFGPATVAISASAGDTICNGAAVTLSTATYLAGSTPAYQWRVNGTVVSAATSYTYVPAAGDIVICRLTSSASCATPAVAYDTLTLTVLPILSPAVAIVAMPNDTVCQSTPVLLTAYPTNGGTAPAYTWLKNGVVSDTGVTYDMTPADGDLIKCVMTSNAWCRTADTVQSNAIKLTVLPSLVPSVTINASPGFAVIAGDEIMFTATVSNAGTAPVFEWLINSTTITGATSSSFTWNSFANNDTVRCKVTSSAPCGGISTTASEAIHINNVGVATSHGNTTELVLIPNPNKGTFMIRGTIQNKAATKAEIQVLNLLGQEVFRQSASLTNGRIDTTISLDSKTPNGVYLVRIVEGADETSIRFIVTQ